MSGSDVGLHIPRDFEFSLENKYGKGIVKMVRFTGAEPNIKEYESNLEENILVKEYLPCQGKEEVNLPPGMGFYTWDDGGNVESYRNNTLFNKLSPEVNDNISFMSCKPMASIQAIKKMKADDFATNYSRSNSRSDSVRFITVQILCPPYGSTSEKEMDKYPTDKVIDSLIYIMEILQELDDGKPLVCISYSDGFSISNRPGKDQRPRVRKILDKMIDHLNLQDP